MKPTDRLSLAALYGAGARLDEDSSLFFLLRGMKMEELAGSVVEKSAEKLLRKRRVAKSKDASRTLDLDDAGLENCLDWISGAGKKVGENHSPVKTYPKPSCRPPSRR